MEGKMERQEGRIECIGSIGPPPTKPDVIGYCPNCYGDDFNVRLCDFDAVRDNYPDTMIDIFFVAECKKCNTETNTDKLLKIDDMRDIKINEFLDEL